jgi:beta-lactamase regulating signal transducer with metallopeptidase domain
VQAGRPVAHCGTPTAIAANTEELRKVIAQLRLVHPVALRISAEVISPMAMGIWRTSVILPLSEAMSLPAEQLEAVLAHELAHIGRWDYFCNIVQTAIECLSSSIPPCGG